MFNKLMPSQKRCKEDILSLGEKYYRRENVVLFGEPQIGKTYLMKHLSEKNDKYIYINFTEKYLQEMLSSKRLGMVNFVDLQEFLRTTFRKYGNSDKVIILDEIDSINSVITGNKEHQQLILYRQFLTMDQSIKYLFVASNFQQSMVDGLAYEFGERVLVLPFEKKDKEHIIRECLNNINLFDLGDIKNIRQLTNAKL